MYDEIIVRDKIEYGIIRGNGKLFYIKVGNGGDVYGSEDRYFRISRQIHDGYGCSVLVASNPVELSIRESIVLDMDFAKEAFPNVSEILALGHSNGGQMLASCAYLYPEIKRVLAVNAPLIINLHKTKAGIKNFAGEKMHMVYGSKDPCFMYTPVLNACVCEKFSYSIVENANHDFKDMAEEFVALPKQFLF